MKGENETKKSPTDFRLMELHSKELQNDEMEAPKRRHVSPEERQQIINKLRLVPKKDVYFKKFLIN